MENIDERLVQTVILLHRQYSLLERVIETQGSALANFERAIADGRQTIDDVFDVYSYVFALVDHIDRYRKIAFAVPRLNHKSKEFRSLKLAIEKLEEIRNKFQHINQYISNEFSGPLLGSVSWVSESKIYQAVLTELGRHRSAPGIYLNTQSGEYSHKYTYVYNDTYYDLQAAITGVRSFDNYVTEKIKMTVDGKPFSVRDHFAAFRVQFAPVDVEPSDAEAACQ